MIDATYRLLSFSFMIGWMNTTEEKVDVHQPSASPALVLRLVYSGSDVLTPPETWTPGRGATPIGREVQGGICLSRDRRASRLHATVHRGVTGTLRVVDEGSRNGTMVNGRRVEDALLADGDLLSLGDSHLVVRAMPPGLKDALIPSLIGVAPP